MKKALTICILGILIATITIKKVEVTNSGMLVTFKNDSGYYIGE